MGGSVTSCVAGDPRAAPDGIDRAGPVRGELYVVARLDPAVRDRAHERGMVELGGAGVRIGKGGDRSVECIAASEVRGDEYAGHDGYE